MKTKFYSKSIIFGAILLLCAGFLIYSSPPPLYAAENTITDDMKGKSGANVRLDEGVVDTPYGGIGRYQNYITYSEAIDNAIWSKSGGGAPTVNANAASAPDGAATADEIVWANPTASTETVNQSLGITGASKTYTISFWIKQGTTATVTNTRTRFVGTGLIDLRTHSVPSNWERRNFTVTVGGGEAGTLNFRFEQQSDHGAGRMLVWGVQIEESSTLGVYTKTTTPAVSTASRGIVTNADLVPSGNLILGGNLYVTGSGPHYISNGNVGIGTMVPGAKLEVAAVTGGNTSIFNVDSGRKAISFFQGGTEFGSLGSSGAGASMYFTSASGKDFVFVNSTGELARFRDNNNVTFVTGVNGNVGIGTTSPVGLLQVGTSPSPGLLVTSAGSVGIGEASLTANQKLTVRQDIQDATIGGLSTATAHLWLKNLNTGASTNTAKIGFNLANSSGQTSYAFVGAQQGSSAFNSDLFFSTENGGTVYEAMRIKNTGYVGIGTTSPNEKLEIYNGTIRIVNTGVGSNTNINFYANGKRSVFSRVDGAWNGLTDPFVMQNVTDGPISINSVVNDPTKGIVIAATSGNVGIGTTGPLTKLHLLSESLSVPAGALSNDKLVLEGTDSVLGLYSADDGAAGSQISLGEITAGALTNKWTMARDATNAGGELRFIYGTNANPYTNSTVGQLSTGGNFWLGGTSAATAPVMAIQSTGNVGIGTTGPYEKLNILGNIKLRDSGTVGSSYIGTTAGGQPAFNIGVSGGSQIEFEHQSDNSDKLHFITHHTGVSHARRMTIDIDGYVGIGTTLPGAKLDIRGDLKANDILVGAVGPAYEKEYYLADSYPSFDGWSGTSAVTTTLGNVGMLGGYNVFGAGAYVQKTIPSLSAGDYVVEFNYYFIDSWDGTESGRFFWNGVQKWVQAVPYPYDTAGSNLGGGSSYAESNNFDVSKTRYSVTVTHAGGDAVLKFDSNIDEAASNESFGINNIRVYRVTPSSRAFYAGTSVFTGNVGIGSTAPGAALDVAGSIRATGNITSTGGGIGGWSTGTGKVYVTSTSDNVGIGTTGPLAKLEIAGSGASAALKLFDTDISGAAYGKTLFYQDGDTLTMQSYYANEAGSGSLASFGPSSIVLSQNVTVNGKNLYVTGTGPHYFSQGNVGIGTMGPNTLLHVNGGTDMTAGWIRTSMLEATFPVQVFYSNYSTTDKYAGIGYDNTAAMRFWVNAGTADVTASSAVMSILNSGSVGIGTTAPTLAKLVVNGGVGNTAAIFGDSNPLAMVYNNPILGFNAYYSGAWRVFTGGKYTGMINMDSATGNFEWNTGDAPATTGLTATMTPRLTILNDGKVGMGTTNPDELLHVRKNQNSDTSIKLENPNTTDTLAFADFQVISNGTRGDLQSISSLYTTTDIADYIRLLADSTAAGLILHSKGTTGGIQFWVGNSDTRSVAERVRIDSAGNVGIGTTIPAYKLEVISDISAPIFRDRNNPTTYYVDPSGTSVVNTINPAQIGGHTVSGTLNMGNQAITGVYSIEQYTSSNWKLDNTGKAYFAGNVGIGTTGPNQKLETSGNILLGANNVNSFMHGGAIVSMSADSNILIVADSNDTTGPADGGDIVFGSGSSIDTDVTRTFTFADAYPTGVPRTEHMRIKGTGNVGIGTTSPGAQLDISSDGYAPYNLKLTGTGSVGSFINFNATGTGGKTYNIGSTADGTGTSGYFGIWNNTVGYMFAANSNGDVGIGGATATGITNGLIGATLVAKGTGNVGIGTTNPTTSLFPSKTVVLSGTANVGYIAKATGSTQEIGFGSNGSGLYMDVAGAATATNNFISFRTTNTNSDFTMSEAMRITSFGYVGIGTTAPGGKLDVAGPGMFFSTQTAAARRILEITTGPSAVTLNSSFLGASSVVPLAFAIDSSEKMRIATDGSVGIGTTAPEAKLDITGPLRINSAGDTGIAQDLVLTNIDASTIKSYSPLTVQSGGSNDNYNLTLKGTGTGKVYVDDDLEITGALTLPALSIPTSGTITFGSDTNIYRSEANTLKTDDTLNITGNLQVTGAGPHYISAGNVGIGTAVPNSKLNVYSTFSGAPTGTVYGSYYDMNLSNVTNTDKVGLYSGIRGTVGYTGTLTAIYGELATSGAQNNGNIAVYGYAHAASAEGNYGVRGYATGGTFTNVGVRAEASGTGPMNGGYVPSTFNGNFAVWAKADTTGPRNIGVYATASGGSTANYAAIFDAGNVGIGTTAPGSKLHIVGQTRISGSNPARLTIEPEGATTNLWNFDNSAGTLRIFREDYASSGTGINGSVKMAIQNDGNVGIGLTSPAALLHIVKDDSSTNTQVELARIGRSTTGTAATNIGAYTSTFLEDTGGSMIEAGRAGFLLRNATAGVNTAGEFSVKVERETYSDMVEALTVYADGGTKWICGNSSRDNGPDGFGYTIGSANTMNWQFDGTNRVQFDWTSPNASIRTLTGANLQFTTLGSGDTISFDQGNNGANIFINTSGNVGIGTTGPGRRLAVVGDTGVTHVPAIGVYSGSTLVIDLQANNGVYGPLIQFPTGAGGFDMFNYRFFGADGTYGYKWTTKGSGASSVDRFSISGNVDTANVAFINSNVGIGIAGPVNKLAVVASTAIEDESILRLSGGSSGFSGSNELNQEHSIIFDLCAYSGASGVVQRDAAKIGIKKYGGWNEADQGAGIKSDIIFYTQNGTIATPSLGEKMRIQYNGNVGIGTVGPASKLDVQGQIYTHSSAGTGGITLEGRNGWSSSVFTNAYYNGANDVYRETGRGAFRMLLQHDGDTAPQYISFAGAPQGTAGGAISWSEIMRLQRNGNVGIGTTGPAGKLYVLGDSSVATSVYIDNPSTALNSNLIFRENGVDKAFIRYINSTNALGSAQQNDLQISNSAGDITFTSGNVGIGTTTPGDILRVVKADASTFSGLSGAAGSHTNIAIGRTALEARFGIAAAAGHYANGSVAGDAVLRVDSSSQKLHLLAGGGNAVMTITSGNVGIGTTNPGVKLEVAGGGTTLAGPVVVNGSFTVNTGPKSAAVPTSMGMRRLYSVEAADARFEDFGSAKLVDGEVEIKLDPLFLETVTISDEYPMIISLTLTSDSPGLYVAKKSNNSFVVKEIQGGKGSPAFDYRITAMRKGFEKQRLELVEENGSSGEKTK